MEPTPPSRALRFLRWFCREDAIEEIEGDLIEVYEMQFEKSPSKAKRKFIWSVIRYLRPEFIKAFNTGQHSNTTAMIQHNFKLTYRNFFKYKSSFFINLAGLTSGLACTLLIFLWVSDELSIDQFHEKGDQIYQVFLNQATNGGVETITEAPGLLAKEMEQTLPEVIATVKDTRSEWFGKRFTFSDGENRLKTHGKFSSEGYFTMFDFPLKFGNPEQVLKAKNSLVISESMAIKLYGTVNGVVGKVLDWQLLNIKNQVTITGIFQDLPNNTTESFDFILPFNFYEDLQGDGIHWGNYNVVTYVEMAKGTNIEAFNQKTADFVSKRNDDESISLFIGKYADNYLHGTFENGVKAGGRIEYVNLFSIIAGFILVIACINFMNLTTARASRRLKEIGVKKTLGAKREGLIAQYLFEAITITFIALILACLIDYFLLPAFNDLTGKTLTLQFTPKLLLGGLVIVLITGILAGSYPALYLSGFKPISVLKGKLQASFGEVWTRKGLVVFQFVLSIVMIVCVFVVYKQIEYVQAKDVGYDRSAVIKVPLEGESAENIKPFMRALKQVPGVVNATATSHAMVENSGTTTGVSWPGKDPEVAVRFQVAKVYYDFIETLGITLLEGRNYTEEFTNEETKVILNQTAIELMGFDDPIGQKINMWGEEREIIGIVKDFNYASLHSKIEPMLFYFKTDRMLHTFVKIDDNNVQESLSNIDAFYKSYNPGFTFDYEFLDQSFEAQYLAEQRVSKLSRCFAGIAIIISCLGLFGLAAFTAERRKKEIGVRKILGANNFGIIKMLSNDFSKMVIMAIVIALPISYYLTKTWLSDFAYSIALSWWFFAGAGILALVIAWITVGMQTFKAANVNPVDCLKDE